MDFGKIEAPSGRELCSEEVKLLVEYARIGTVQYKKDPVRLHRGVESHLYVSAREELTRDARILGTTGDIIFMHAFQRMLKCRDTRRPHFLGIPTAGHALAIAASLGSRHETKDTDVAGSTTVREAPKTTHGASEHRSGWAVGPDAARFRDFFVDNVVTDAGTKIDWIPRFEADGYAPRESDWIVLFDRNQGGVERMKEVGIKNVLVIFNILDAMYVYDELGIWPKEWIENIRREIAENQFRAP